MKNLFGKKDIYIYGAQNNAKSAFLYIENGGLLDKFRGFAVTSKAGNPEKIEGYNVELFSEIDCPQNYIFIIAVSNVYTEEIKTYIENAGVTEVVIWDADEMAKIIIKNVVLNCMKDDLYIEDDPNDETYVELLRKGDDENDKNRMKYKVLPQANVPFYKGSEHIVAEFDFEGDYIKTFGKYRHISSLPVTDVFDGYKDMFDIYKVCSHMDQNAEGADENDFLIPIQAGAALTDIKKYDNRDNLGENISDRNKTMAEMTAIYWIWKNAPKSGYKGICHYRRQFIVSPEEYCAIINNDIDVVLNVPRFVLPNLGDQFTALTDNDKGVLLDIIKEKYPEYYNSAVNHFNQQLFYSCNMMIAKQEVFDEYCKFAFDILLSFDDYFKKIGEERNVKFVGYWAELITSIFFVHNKDRFNTAVADFRIFMPSKVNVK